MTINETKTYLVKIENGHSGRVISELVQEETAFLAVDEIQKKYKGDCVWLLVDVKVVE
jgi:hypothetical protein